VKIAYPSAEQIPVAEQKQYANQFIECPTAKVIPITGGKSADGSVVAEKPGLYAATLPIKIGFDILQGKHTANGCTGTLTNISL
jgi:hypothetical protein